jgi:hypothetical protein
VIEAADDLEAVRIVTSQTVEDIQSMSLLCERCATRTAHEFNEGSLGYSRGFSIFLMFPLAIGIIVALEKLGVTGVTMDRTTRRITILSIFGLRYFLIFFTLRRVLLRGTTWTCKTCGTKRKTGEILRSRT